MIPQLLYRVKNKIEREQRKKIWQSVPWQDDITFRKDDASWYDPFLAGPSTFVGDCSSAETIAQVLGIIKKLTPDRFLNYNIEFYEAGLKRFGNRWRYADITTVLYGICKNINVRNYLEIGVRRGRSMSIVGHLRPDADIVGFDMWIANYAGLENPGADLVASEMKKAGHRGQLSFINGNSRQTVPDYFRQNAEAYFDLVTVDGDHTRRGAIIDLKNVLPRIKIGGFLIFDDVCNPELTYMKKLWEKVVVKSGRFQTYLFDESGFGTAFAIRRY